MLKYIESSVTPFTQLSYMKIFQYWSYLRACSHEPGTVNYPGASVTSRSHDDLLSLGKVAPGQVHRHMITTNLSEFF